MSQLDIHQIGLKLNGEGTSLCEVPGGLGSTVRWATDNSAERKNRYCLCQALCLFLPCVSQLNARELSWEPVLDIPRRLPMPDKKKPVLHTHLVLLNLIVHPGGIPLCKTLLQFYGTPQNFA